MDVRAKKECWGVLSSYLSQRIDSDSQENVEQSVVAEECEEDEVPGVNEASASATLRLDTKVHHLVPILTSQNLKEKGYTCTKNDVFRQ